MEDCFEALARLACLKALVTDDEIAAAGALDGGDSLLKLRADGEENEWYDEYYA